MPPGKQPPADGFLEACSNGNRGFCSVVKRPGARAVRYFGFRVAAVIEMADSILQEIESLEMWQQVAVLIPLVKEHMQASQVDDYFEQPPDPQVAEKYDALLDAVRSGLVRHGKRRRVKVCAAPRESSALRAARVAAASVSHSRRCDVNVAGTDRTSRPTLHLLWLRRWWVAHPFLSRS